MRVCIGLCRFVKTILASLANLCELSNIIKLVHVVQLSQDVPMLSSDSGEVRSRLFITFIMSSCVVLQADGTVEVLFVQSFYFIHNIRVGHSLCSWTYHIFYLEESSEDVGT